MEQIQGLARAVEQLGQRVMAQENRPSPQLPPTQPPVEPKLPLPVRFSGDRSQFSNFRDSCLLYFKLRPYSSGPQSQQVGIIISLLQGDPQTWAFGLPASDPALRSVEEFFSAMGVLYADPDQRTTADNKLRSIRQGRRPAEEYATEFRRWAVLSQWCDLSLKSQYRHGLSDAIKDVLVNHPESETLDQLIHLSVRVDRRLRERRAERAGSPASSIPPTFSPPSSSGASAEEPMQLGITRLSESEKGRRRSQGLCLYCGGQGHFAKSCPRKVTRRAENFSA